LGNISPGSEASCVKSILNLSLCGNPDVCKDRGNISALKVASKATLYILLNLRLTGLQWHSNKGSSMFHVKLMDGSDHGHRCPALLGLRTLFPQDSNVDEMALSQTGKHLVQN